ncbi:MAG: hypothetical protein WCT85_06350, partial [Parachlamydiales bacterium]
MRTVNLLASAMHLLIVLAMFAIGFFLVMIYLSPHFCNFFLDLLLNDSVMFLKIGLTIGLFTVISFVTFYYIHKGQYIKFYIKQNKYQVNIDIIKSYLQNYLKVMYPDKKNELDVYVILKDKLEIVIDMESLNGQKEFIMDLEPVIKNLLSEKLNYQ